MSDATESPWPQRLPYAGAVLVAAVVLGVALRFVLAFAVFPGQGLQGDVDWHAKWLVGIAGTGPGGFYAWAATQPVLPPVWLWLLWPLGELATLLSQVMGQPAAAIAPVLVKIPPIIADLLIALVLYAWLSRRRGHAPASPPRCSSWSRSPSSIRPSGDSSTRLDPCSRCSPSSSSTTVGARALPGSSRLRC